MDESLQGTRAEARVVAVFHDIALRLRAQLYAESPVRKAPIDILQDQRRDLFDILSRERLKENDLIEPVQEFGPEGGVQLLHNELLRLLRDLPLRVNPLQKILRSDIRGQDNDGIFEIHCSSLGIRDPTVIQHLQKDIEDIRMRLLDLIEEDHGVGLSPDRLRELSSLLVADIAGGRADQAGDRILLHILRHVDPHHRILIVEEILRERLRELRLSDTGGAEEEEGADRLRRILDARFRAENRIGDPPHRVILSDQSLMELLIQMEHLRALGLIELRHRNPGPAADDAGDLLLRHLVSDQSLTALALGLLLCLLELFLHGREILVLQLCDLLIVVFLLCDIDLGIQLILLFAERLELSDGVLLILPLGLLHIEAVPELRELLLEIREPLLRERVVFLLQRKLLDLKLQDPPTKLIHVLRHGIHLRLDHRAGLVHEVDRLIRKETVRDIAVGERRRGDKRGIGDLHAVVDLVSLLDAPEDGDRILDARLIHLHRLEPPLERRVLFDILPVLIERRGADAVELASCEKRL